MEFSIKKAGLITAVAALSFTAVQAQNLEEGKKLVRYERYSSAEKVLQPLAATDPIANYYLGISELGQGNTEQARTIFGKYPSDPANMAGMAWVNFATGNKTDGMRLAKSVADMAKRKDVMPYVWAADAVNYGGGDAQQAIEWYKKALERMDNVDIRIGLGDAYQRLAGGGGEAMNNYEKAVAMDPNNSLGYSRIGKLWYDARNYESALSNFQKAKDADPSNPLPYNDLANAYYWVGKYDQALQNIEEYLKLSDKAAEDQVRYLNLLYLAKKYPEAIQKANDLIASGNAKPGFYGILAYSQLETGDSTNALANVRKYFATQDHKRIGPMDYLRYGRIFLANAQADSAAWYFNEAVTQDTAKDKADIYREIAEGFKGLKTTEGYAKAGQWYGKVVSETPEPKVLDYYYWGFWSFYGQQYDAAEKAFALMAEKFPEQPSALYWQGRVAGAKDSEAKGGGAVKYYEQWLAIPDNETYQHKDAELMMAYQYLAAYYYNKGDKAKSNDFADKILKMEPNNEFAKSIKNANSSAKK